MQEIQESWVRSLNLEDLLEKEMATHSSILAWKNSMDRGAWLAEIHGFTKSQTWLSIHTHTHTHTHTHNFSNFSSGLLYVCMCVCVCVCVLCICCSQNPDNSRCNLRSSSINQSWELWLEMQNLAGPIDLLNQNLPLIRCPGDLLALQVGEALL